MEENKDGEGDFLWDDSIMLPFDVGFDELVQDESLDEPIIIPEVEKIIGPIKNEELPKYIHNNTDPTKLR